MKTIFRRVGRLEKCYGTGKRIEPLRILVSFRWKGTVNWAESTCTRTRYPGGITEMLILEGDGHGVAEAELERFIQSFPIRSGSAQ